MTEFHPVQIDQDFRDFRNGFAPMLPTEVTLKAYEVYCHVYRPQPAMVEGSCRGGFSLGEIIGFLYASSFPKNEWAKRVDEAFKRPERKRV